MLDVLYPPIKSGEHMSVTMQASSLAAMFGAAETPQRPIKEAQVAELHEFAERYAAGARHRFKVGDLVTPVANCNYTGAGEPHLVLAVSGGPSEPVFDPERIGSGAFGFHPDVLVAAFDRNNCLSKVWFESCFLISYTGPT